MSHPSRSPVPSPYLPALAAWRLGCTAAVSLGLLAGLAVAAPNTQDKADAAIKALAQRVEAVKKTAAPGRSCIFLDGDMRRAERAFNNGITTSDPAEAERQFQEAIKAAQEGLARKAPPNCR